MNPALHLGAGPRPGRPDPGRGVLAGLDAHVFDTPVLIIEDDAVIAWMLESLFEEMGFRSVALAPTALDAIAAAEARSPGLIVSDINLGRGMDGIEAVGAIVPRTAAAVIFVTGFANAEARRRIGQTIPEAVVLPKPVLSAELRGAVRAILRARRGH